MYVEYYIDMDIVCLAEGLIMTLYLNYGCFNIITGL